MTKIFAAETQPGIGSVLRIMADESFDPVSTDPSEAGKMLFDSRRGSSIGYVYEIFTVTYDSRYRDQSGSYIGQWWFFSDHDLDNPLSEANHYFECGAIILFDNGSDTGQTLYLFDTWWPFGYMPIVEQRLIDPDLPANTFAGASVDYTEFSSGFGFVLSKAGYEARTKSVNGNLGDDSNFDDLRDGYEIVVRADVGDHSENYEFLISVLQVPARDDPMPDFSTTPIPGQQALLLSPTVARMALPGRDVGSTNLDHFIFHEDKIPAKLMRAGDVFINGNDTVDLICPLPLTPLTYMDFMIRRQSDTEFWNPPFFDSISSDKSLAFTYELKSDRVTVMNGTAESIVIRYMIFADSEDPYTIGGEEVFVVANDGTRNYLQIKRPGSSDLAPSVNDIMLDTRLAYVPILAQGFLPWTSGFPTAVLGGERYKGERKATVLIDNPAPSLKLFAKQSVVFSSLGTPLALRNGTHRVFTDAGGWTGRCSQDSSWANIYADESGVDFYMAGSNPLGYGSGGEFYDRRATDSGGMDIDAIGLSYVIFGIPNSL